MGIEIKDSFEAIVTDYNIKVIYQKIEENISLSLKRNLAIHLKEESAEKFDWPQWQAIKLKQLKNFRLENINIFSGYQECVDKYIIKETKKQFKEGALKVRKEALKAGLIKKEDAIMGGSFFGINKRKVKALTSSVLNNLKDAKSATLRQADDVFRSTVYKSVQMASSGGITAKQAVDLATKDFFTRGFKTIEYKDGSLHNIADYADMAVRTATKRANLMGEGSMRNELGIRTVYISKHGGTCEKCTQWQGKIYVDDVWSGGSENDGEYPLLSTAIAGGLFHPRCKHGSSTYIEGITVI